MINFAAVEYLLLIALIPVFFIVYGLMRRVRKKRIVRFGDASLVESLTPNVSKRKGWVKLVFLSLAWLSLCVGMARPQLGATLKEQEVKGVEIMIALDVSNSMLAEDYSPNRLERAKLAISKLTDRLQGDRVGLIVFAGQAFVQLPITADYVSAKIFLNSINTESVPIQGTEMGDAIVTACRSFSPESQNSRAIILITDGENHEGDPVKAAGQAVETGARVFTVGVGSSEGKPIPMNGELLKDRDGNIVVSRLDEKTLKDIADAGNGMYVRAGNSEFGLNPIIDDIQSMEARQYQSMVFQDFDEQFMYFFGMALFFIVLAFLISDRRSGREIFGAGRYAGVVLMALCLSGVSLSAQTKEMRQVRSGNRAFEKDELQKAEVDYKKALLQDSTSIAANFNLGNLYYRMENWQEARKHYEGLGDTLKAEVPCEKDVPARKYEASQGKVSDYYHNLGDLAVKEKDWQGAVDAFKESLRHRPDDMGTKANLAYAQKMLEDQQNQQQNQDQNQQNQNNDQNQDQNKDQNQDQNQNQNQDQNKDQNQDQNKDQQDQNQQPQPQDAKITPQEAQQILQAIQDKEKDTQEKVQKEKAEQMKTRQREKNW